MSTNERSAGAGAGGAHPKAVAAGLIVRQLAGETLVYDTRRHRLHCLGPLLARVWQACSGRRTPEQIAERLSSAAARLDGPAVRLALARLRRAHLVERVHESGSERRNGSTKASSRRAALVRAAGLAGLGLATVGAPTVLQAATCTTLDECQALGNRQCTGLPCCAAANVPAGATCRRRGNGIRCDCS